LINLDFALPFVAFAQCFSCGYLYRYKDVAKEIGYRSYLMTIIAYLGAVIAALLCANASTNPITAGVSGGLVFFVVTLMVTLFSAKLPETNPYKLSSCWNKLYWITMYQPDQLRKDLNTVVACHGRTSIPFMWALIIKFVTGPVTLIMCSFSLIGIVELVTDPIAAFGVFTGMLIVLFTIVGIIVPRFLNPLIPLGEEKGWKDQYNNLPGKCFTKETNDQSNETVSERV
jgi:solute carrier family 6 (neurotransmitter transporter, GABA) member 1